MRYDFPVEKRNIFYGDECGEIRKLIADRKMIVNAETNEPISIVSDRYNIIEHKHVVDQFDSIYGLDREAVDLTSNGGVMFARYNLHEAKDREISVGDMVKFNLVAFNSYNFITGCGFEIVGKRLVCSNGLTVPHTLCRFSFRHRKNDGIKELSSAIFKSAENTDMIVKKWRMWNSTPIREDSVKYFYSGLNIQRDLREYLLEKSLKAKNMWDLFNVLSFYTTHEMRCRGVNKIANQHRKTHELLGAFYKHEW